MLKRVFLLALIAATLVIIAFGCGESDWKRCYTGDYISCNCSDGGFGYAQCNDNATFNACVCDGQTPGLDAAAEAGDDSGQHSPVTPGSGPGGGNKDADADAGDADAGDADADVEDAGDAGDGGDAE